MNTRPLILTAKAIGKKYDIDVVIAGTTACTNGKVITLPAVEGPYAERMARGYLDHESGHVRFTDFNFAITPDFKGHLLNIIEDVWTENEMGKEYPGCLINLRELIELLVLQEGCFQPDPTQPETSLLTWIMGRARIDVLGHVAMQNCVTNAEPLTKMALGRHFPKLQELVGKIGRLSSTADAEALRNEIMQLLNKALNDFDKKQKQPKQDNADSGNQQGQSGNDNADSGNQQGQSGNDNADSGDQQGQSGNDNDKSTSQDTDKSNTSKSVSNGSGSKDSQSDKTDKQGAGAGTGGATPQAAQQALQEAMNPNAVTMEFGIGEILKSMMEAAACQQAYAGVPSLPRAEPLQKKGIPFQDLSSLKTHTSKLRARMAGLVQSHRLKKSTPKASGTRLDRRVLTRLSTGDTRVFQRKEEKRDINTAIVLLLDGSGSMGGQSSTTKMSIASRSCYIANEALNSIPGVKTTSAMFNGYRDKLFLMSDFGEKPKSERFNHDGSGGTMLGHALFWGYAELMNRPEPRKICIAFSDGDACDSEHTKKAIDMMRKSGIEVIGIGIQDMALRRYLPDSHHVIHDLEMLTPALLDLLEKLLNQQNKKT